MDAQIARIASAIGEPARTRILYSLMDGRARTSTELAMVAEVTPSTASVHLNRLRAEKLIRVSTQGRHRYYSLAGINAARALEALCVLADARSRTFEPSTPPLLREARTCYDHMAGAVAVQLHDRLIAQHWLENYHLTPRGAEQMEKLGVDVRWARAARRKFAYACLDWSERRPHLGGALGAALLTALLAKKWLVREPGSRALSVTRLGRRELAARAVVPTGG